MDYTKIYKRFTSIHSRLPYIFLRGYAFNPLHILFELTYRCNLRCSMCQFLPLVKECNTLIKKTPQLELSLNTILKVISQLPRTTLLTFTGGEPFLRKDICDILQFAVKRNRCHLITNGTLLNTERVDFLLQSGANSFISTGLLMVEISLEGTKDIHDRTTAVKGSFDKTVENIKLLTEAKKRNCKKYPLLNIATVITKTNIEVLPDIVDLAAGLGADIVSFLTYCLYPHYNRLKKEIIIKESNPVYDEITIDKEVFNRQMDKIISRSKKHKGLKIRFSPHGCLPEDIFSYYTGSHSFFDIDKFICYSPWTRAVITSCGDVMPCSNYFIGNVKENSILSLWNQKKLRDFRNKLKKNGIFPQCDGCCMVERKK